MPRYGVAPAFVGPRYRVRPYSGVFVYGPRPVYHGSYAGGSDQVVVQERHLPDRKIDRDNSLAVGIRAGSYMGAYQGANAFSDVGLGLTARYRPVESLGLEVAGQRHTDAERIHTTGSASAVLFAFPWSRLSPYVLAGGTWTDRSIDDEIWRNDAVQTVSSTTPLFGAHAGAGLEIGLGNHLALDLEARYVHYLNTAAGDPTLPGAVNTNVGLLWHF